MGKKLTKNIKSPTNKEDNSVKDLTKNKSRRDFITLTTCAMAGIGATSGLWLKQEIEAARTVNAESLRDPELDEKRVYKRKDEWLIMIGICTHL
ncbi:MAG: ubiquinol-cytochrome c reductase iron-sulfur subunit N-terminal domain-containing protein, partial [Wolbachia sp.]